MIGFLWVVSLGFTTSFPNKNSFSCKKHTNITYQKDLLLHLDFCSQKIWNGYSVLIHFTEQEAHTMECDYIANMLENDFMNLKFSITLQNDRQTGRCRYKFPWEHLKSIWSLFFLYMHTYFPCDLMRQKTIKKIN